MFSCVCVQKTVERVWDSLSKACLELRRRYGPSRIVIPFLARSVSHILAYSNVYLSGTCLSYIRNFGEDRFSASSILNSLT